jgi:two-component system, NarL family, response regulator
MTPAPDSNTAPRLTRIMLVDDHFMARIGLALPINQQPDMQVIAEACNGQEALELYRQHLPDVVIMDYALPDKTGPEVVTAIRTEFPGTRVLLLSAHEGEEHIHRAVEAGVCGYLTKNSDCALVLDSIRSIATGQSAFPPAIAAKAAARRLRPSLTERELEILNLLAQGNTNKLIAAELGFSESLVKQELVRIFDKLGAKDRAHAVMLAIERGQVNTF